MTSFGSYFCYFGLYNVRFSPIHKGNFQRTFMGRSEQCFRWPRMRAYFKLIWKCGRLSRILCAPYIVERKKVSHIKCEFKHSSPPILVNCYYTVGEPWVLDRKCLTRWGKNSKRPWTILSTEVEFAQKNQRFVDSHHILNEPELFCKRYSHHLLHFLRLRIKGQVRGDFFKVKLKVARQNIFIEKGI